MSRREKIKKMIVVKVWSQAINRIIYSTYHQGGQNPPTYPET